MRKRQHLRSGRRDSNAFNTYRDRKTNVPGAQSIMNERNSGGEDVREESREHITEKLVDSLHFILVVIGSHWMVLSRGVM